MRVAGVLVAVGLCLPAHAQESLIAELEAENARLRAEVAALREAGAGQCSGGKGDQETVSLLMEKLSQLSDAAAVAALGPPQTPIVLPDSVLSALIPNQYILTLAEGEATPESPEAAATAFGLQPDQILFVYSRVLNGFSAKLDETDRARLAADPRIAGVEQDGFVFPTQEAAGSSGYPYADETMPPLLPPGPDLVDVYVFDSGIRAGHRGLAGLVGTGFTSFRNGIGTEDCNGHGTHVAGSIGGRGFGQSSHARLFSVKVLDRDSFGDVSTVIAGVEWVLAQPGDRRIANMSLTRLDPAPMGKGLMDRAVLAMVKAGIPVVVAAGNAASDARLYTPARLPEAITVGAMAGEEVGASSNTGEGVDLYTEGAGIASASLADMCGFERMSGTSMAAARVTGIATELLASGVSAADLPAALQDLAEEVETGEFAGEVVRHVLTTKDTDMQALCAGSAREFMPERVAD